MQFEFASKSSHTCKYFKFWVRIGLLITSKCTWTTPKRANLHDISVIYPSGVFSCVLDLSGARRGVSCLFSQWRALFELWWRPNLSTLWEGICIMDTSRAPLYLVHFWPEFMVLGKKRPLVRVIACNLQKCGKNAIFGALASGRIWKLNLYKPLLLPS